jgi:hypothetical protein
MDEGRSRSGASWRWPARPRPRRRRCWWGGRGRRRCGRRAAPTWSPRWTRRPSALIVERIRARFPDDAIVAEEFSGGAVGRGRSWIVDPLDGTVNYVHGHPFACVSVAFADERGPAAG